MNKLLLAEKFLKLIIDQLLHFKELIQLLNKLLKRQFVLSTKTFSNGIFYMVGIYQNEYCNRQYKNPC